MGGHLRKVMYLSRAILKVSKDTDSIIFLDDVCHCMVTLMVKKVFPDVQPEPPVPHAVPTACDIVPGHQGPGSVLSACIIGTS